MEQAAELAFVDHRDSRRDRPRVRDPLGSSNRPAPSFVVRYWDLAATEKTEFNDDAIPLALLSV
jgi:hypothetical protein